MDIFLNFGLAWISVVIAIFLAAAYLTRKVIIKFPKSRHSYIRINKGLRKYHKYIGLALIIIGLIHGLFSSDKLLTVNLGTVSWIFSILLGVSYMVKKKLVGKRNWMFFHRILVIIFSLSIIIHVIDAGGIQIFKVLKATNNNQISETYTPLPTVSVSDIPTESPVETTAVPTELPAGNEYKDGTYTGEATGFQPGLIVEVTITDNKIISVEVTEHNEINSSFWSTPVYYIPKWIVEAQTTEVDTISGASYTSTGIINAVNDALRQALVSGTVSDDLSLPSGRRH